MSDYVEDHAAANAMIPAPMTAMVPSEPAYALVEIFGHRTHYGEIREVEAFGAKLLEVTDLDTGKQHRYGGASIFSLTMLSEVEMEAHLASGAGEKERQAKFMAKFEAICLARKRVRDAETEGDDETPF